MSDDPGNPPLVLGKRPPTPRPPAGHLAVEPELFALAYRNHCAPAFRIWTQCRNLDAAGSGWVTRDALLACATALDLQPRSILRIITEAPDWFTMTAAGMIFYTAQIKLLAHYHWQATRYSGTATIPATALAPLGRFNAVCYGAWFTLRTHTTFDNTFLTKPLARSVIRKRFGVTLTTLRRWEVLSGVESEKNYLIGEPGKLSESDGNQELHCTCGKYWWNEHIARRQERTGDFTYHGRPRLTPSEHRKLCPDHTFQTVTRRPNSYIPPDVTTGRRRPAFKNAFRSAQYRVQPVPVAAPVPESTEAPPWDCEPNSRHENLAPMGHCLPVTAPDTQPAKPEPKPRERYFGYRTWQVTDMLPPALMARCLSRQLWFA